MTFPDHGQGQRPGSAGNQLAGYRVGPVGQNPTPMKGVQLGVGGEVRPDGVDLSGRRSRPARADAQQRLAARRPMKSAAQWELKE